MDGLPANDFKNINQKSYGLFKAGHIQYVKLLWKDSGKVYIKCACLPEMRKNMEYTVNLIVNRKDGEIEFERCGCQAGKGPHGKHIAALCYCLYVNVGAVRNYETCIAKLQTWNQPGSKKLPWMLVQDINFQKTKQKKGCNKSSKCRAPKDVKSIFGHISTPSKYQESSLEANDTLRSLCTKYKLNLCFLHCLRENTGDENSPEKETVNNVSHNIIADHANSNQNSKSNSVNSKVKDSIDSNTNNTAQ